MSYPTTDKQQKLITWLQSIAPTVFWVISDQPKEPPIPENALQMGILRITEIERQGNDGYFSTWNPNTELFDLQAYACRAMTFTIDIYSSDQSANYVLQDFLTWINFPASIEYFYSNQLGFIKHSTIRNLSLISSGRWRNRFQVDIKFNIVDNVFFTAPNIVTAPTSGTINKQ